MSDDIARLRAAITGITRLVTEQGTPSLEMLRFLSQLIAILETLDARLVALEP